MPEVVRFLRRRAGHWNKNGTKRGRFGVSWDPLTFAGPQVSSLGCVLAWLLTQETDWLRLPVGRIHFLVGRLVSQTRPAPVVQRKPGVSTVGTTQTLLRSPAKTFL